MRKCNKGDTPKINFFNYPWKKKGEIFITLFSKRFQFFVIGDQVWNLDGEYNPKRVLHVGTRVNWAKKRKRKKGTEKKRNEKKRTRGPKGMAASEQRKYTSSITNAFFEYEILPELCSWISLGTTSAMNEFREMIWQMNIILKWGDFKSYFCNKIEFVLQVTGLV